MAQFIPADGTSPITEVKPSNGSTFKLQELYTLLSCGTIEIIKLSDGQLLVIDEEGKITDQPRNERATEMVGFVRPHELVAYLLRLRDAGVVVINAREPLTDLSVESDYIAGDALLVSTDEVR